MKLTRLLVLAALKIAAVIIAIVALLAHFVFGSEHTGGVVAGGLVMALDVVGLIYLVGKLLDPTVGTPQKSVFMLILVGKLALVAGLLWLVLTRMSVSPLGVLLGIGAGLLGLVVGLSTGSASPETQAAMDEYAQRIADAEALKDRERNG